MFASASFDYGSDRPRVGMAFRDFDFPEVQQTLGLTLAEAELFPGVQPANLSAAFEERMRGDIALALALNTEKARSEFIIAPVLSELRRMLGGSFGPFSGVQFDVDVSRGPNGVCGFIRTRSPLQSVLTAPVVAIVGSKNDNVRTGLGPCIAATVAAWEFNARSQPPVAAVYGGRGVEVPAIVGGRRDARHRRRISSRSSAASWESWPTSCVPRRHRERRNGRAAIWMSDIFPIRGGLEDSMRRIPGGRTA